MVFLLRIFIFKMQDVLSLVTYCHRSNRNGSEDINMRLLTDQRLFIVTSETAPTSSHPVDTGGISNLTSTATAEMYVIWIILRWRVHEDGKNQNNAANEDQQPQIRLRIR